MSLEPHPDLLLPRARLGELLQALFDRGYRVIGPKLEDDVIGLDELEGVDELPIGYTDIQGPGHYRVAKRSDEAVFGYAVGPRSFRSAFQLPSQPLVQLRRGPSGGYTATFPESIERPLALFGARGCDLRALAVHDRVLGQGAYPDPRYVSRRQGTFVVAVNCAEPSGTCFCVSMGGGPRAESGHDLALTELIDEGEHRFVVAIGSERGRELIAPLRLLAASNTDREACVRLVEAASQRMGRSFEETGTREALLENLEHPAWDAVGERCLSCGNCTLVCPTCFCTTTEDEIDVTGQVAERHVRHDSCFDLSLSYVHGGPVRSSIKSRYRQFLTHKFATWYDQFGSSGCVGCGRCITSCPVGIDVTEEIGKIRGATHAT